MNPTDETEALDRVVDRLSARFPSLSPARIRQVVDDAHHRLGGAQVRDLVPALVEHAAMEELRKDADPVRIRVQNGISEGGVLRGPQDLDPMERERHEREQHGGFLFGDLSGGAS